MRNFISTASLKIHLYIVQQIPNKSCGESRRTVVISTSSIGGGRGQWLGGNMASAEYESITGVWGQSPWSGVRRAKPPEAESILVIGCPTEPANLAPFQKCPFELR